MATFGTLLAALCLMFVSFCSGDEVPYEDIDKRGIEYTLPELGFSIGELEPFIDSGTIRAHHGGHHRAYTDNLDKALKQWRAELPQDALAKGSIVEILENLDLVPDKYRTAVRNHGGGYLNHCIYWAAMSGNPDQEERRPPAKLSGDIDTAFGSLGKFKDAFSTMAKSLFGSGYVWLSRDEKDELVITTSTNQDCPLSLGLRPILVIDLWEHAYYLRHQFRRLNYIKDWWKVVDWQKVDMLDMWWADLAQDTLHTREEL